MAYRVSKPFVKFRLRLSNHRAVVMTRANGTTYKRIPHPIFGKWLRSNKPFLKQFRENPAKLFYQTTPYQGFNWQHGKFRGKHLKLTFTETYSRPVAVFFDRWVKEIPRGPTDCPF